MANGNKYLIISILIILIVIIVFWLIRKEKTRPNAILPTPPAVTPQGHTNNPCVLGECPKLDPTTKKISCSTITGPCTSSFDNSVPPKLYYNF